MPEKQINLRKEIRVFPYPKVHSEQVTPEKKYIRRMIVSGVLSLFLILVIYYTLPMTILDLSSLSEYSVIVALMMFMLILLIRYFSLLILSYLNNSEYTFINKPEVNHFVSIIVPIYNEDKVLKDSIESLLNLDYDNYEIIMVNDGSTDNTRQVAETLVGVHRGRYSDIKVTLVNKQNAGKAIALNTGIAVSQAEFVLCMDADSKLSPETLKVTMRHFDDPKVGAVAGNVKVLNRKRFLTDLQALEYIEGLNMARAAQSYIRLVNIIPGPIGVFRKKALESVGYYSDDTYAEDADLTLNILTAGWKIYYEPLAKSYTQAPVTLQQLIKQRYRWTRGILQSLRKHKDSIFTSKSPSVGYTFILLFMIYEALIWPMMNIATNAFFIFAALNFGISSLLFYWWAGLAILDLAAALYCITAEREEFRLVWYAIIYRMFFILIIDIAKAMSTIEEFLGIKMSWGKLERQANLTA
jgi:cellulose synthase/poly-beta-1,6-N-acetylglucosamine synthase-like glycosyltransferase